MPRCASAQEGKCPGAPRHWAKGARCTTTRAPLLWEAKLALLGRPVGTKGAPLGLARRTPIGSPHNGAKVFYQ